MNIIQITPGAGGMYCGGCFRDNALVGALRLQGHQLLMVPLYLPLTLDEADQSQGTPIFFSGISVYLEQKMAWFRSMPRWLHRVLASPLLLRWASGSAAKTRAADLGELTLSMLRGEEGNQSRELEELITWLKEYERPDAIILSNALLIGLVRRLKSELSVPVLCLLGGEDTFLDALPQPQRQQSWQTLSERAAEVDAFLAPSHYFAELMSRCLKLSTSQVRVLYNGINPEGYGPAPIPQNPPVLGYFARMCPEKGLETLMEAYLILRERNRVPGLQLRVGGGCGPGDEPLVAKWRERLQQKGLLNDCQFHPNLSKEEKLEFFRSLTVFSTPALYGEAFGLYVIEALASGVPVVQPRHAAFPELLAATGGGVLAEAGQAQALAEAIEGLLLDPEKARALGEAGRRSVLERFHIATMARETALACREAADLYQTKAKAALVR